MSTEDKCWREMDVKEYDCIGPAQQHAEEGQHMGTWAPMDTNQDGVHRWKRCSGQLMNVEGSMRLSYAACRTPTHLPQEGVVGVQGGWAEKA